MRDISMTYSEEGNLRQTVLFEEGKMWQKGNSENKEKSLKEKEMQQSNQILKEKRTKEKWLGEDKN